MNIREKMEQQELELFNLCAAGIGRRTADIDCDGDRLQMGTVRLCGSEHPLSIGGCG